MANQLIGEANPIIRDWAKEAKRVGTERANNFGQMLLNSTTHGMWPNKAFDDPAYNFLKPKALDALKATPQEKADYAAALVPLRAKHDALAAAWAKQSDELKSLFVRIEQLNRANLQRHIAADRRSIVETYYYPGLEGG